jgi:2-oxoglutarate ferredoxin oxidoreductase subunit beta
MFNWIKNRAAPLGEEKEDTIWQTGIYHDVSNTRTEFSQMMRDKVSEIQRRYQNEGSH